MINCENFIYLRRKNKESLCECLKNHVLGNKLIYFEMDIPRNHLK